MSPLYHTGQQATNRNSLWLEPFLQAAGLPFAGVLSEGEVEEAFAAEGVEFGQPGGSIFTPALTLWGFLSQVLHAGELRSCSATVSRIIVLLVTLGRDPCSSDTAAYCRARAKLPEVVIRRLAVQVGERLESQVPADWLWHGRHVKLADGTTLTAPATPANQRVYPQNTAQQPGLGFPIVRMVVLLSLATGLLCDMAVGPVRRKGDGRECLAADPLGCAPSRRHSAGRSPVLLLLPLGLGLAAEPRHGGPPAPAPQGRLPPRPLHRPRRSPDRMALTHSAGMDGRNDLRHHPGDDAAAADPRRSPGARFPRRKDGRGHDPAGRGALSRAAHRRSLP